MHASDSVYDLYDLRPRVQKSCKFLCSVLENKRNASSQNEHWNPHCKPGTLIIITQQHKNKELYKVLKKRGIRKIKGRKHFRIFTDHNNFMCITDSVSLLSSPLNFPWPSSLFSFQPSKNANMVTSYFNCWILFPGKSKSFQTSSIR